jgi:hypothetical protein
MVGLQMAVMLQPSLAETQNAPNERATVKVFLVCGTCISNQGHGLCVSVKILRVERKVQCVLWLAKFESVTCVRREYRCVSVKNHYTKIIIRRWDKQLKEMGSLLYKNAQEDHLLVTSRLKPSGQAFFGAQGNRCVNVQES